MSGSIWKKEFSLRKKDDAPADEATPVEETAVEAVAAESETAAPPVDVAPLPEMTDDYG